MRRLLYVLRRARRQRRGGRLWLFFAVLLLAISAVRLAANLRPLAIKLALAEATDTITVTVNDVVREKLTDGSLDYSNLVTLEKDESGRISALVTNVANINLLQAGITRAVVERFLTAERTTVSVPLGNIIGGAVFSGHGPAVKVTILSVSNVSADFKNEFTSAGINQTRHQILLDVDVTLSILMAGYHETDVVNTQISVAETVIVGTVPETYAAIAGEDIWTQEKESPNS